MYSLVAVLIIIAAIFTGSWITYTYKHSSQEVDRSSLDMQKWWGAGVKPEKEDHSIRSFKIDFNDTMITDLKQRLRNRRRFTKTLEGTHSTYGMNSEYLESIVTYWMNKYDFKKRAELLNNFPHYKTRIQGLDIHYIRVRPKVKENIEVLPLLMLHGWPSSSKEFVKVIPILTTPRDGFNFVFEVIAADLPGFGFSEGTNKPGLSPVEIAIIMRNLMLRLDIDQFYIQAGDWGSQCASNLATIFPNNVLGFHTNMPLSSMPKSIVKLFIGSLFPDLIDSDRPERVYPLKNLFSYILRESGYFHIQATKPDSLGYALLDSPAGLAAYLMEKMAICSNSDQLDTLHGGLDNLDIDDVLDTVTITWVNECVVTSMRIYAENAFDYTKNIKNIPAKVPTAAIKFLYEVLYQPDWILRDKYPNLVHSTVVDYGGHFAALQTPNALADDVFKAVVEFIKFHNTNVL